MSRALRELILIQFKGYWREPGVLFWTLGFPLLIAFVLGLLYSNKPETKYKVAVVSGQENTIPGNEIEIPGKSRRSIVFQKSGLSEAMDAYRSGRVDLVMEYKAGNQVEFYYDPLNSNGESVYLWISRELASPESLSAQKVTPLDQPGTRYIDYLIPGLIALGIMNSTLWGVGWMLIEFRIKKFLRRMIATPMRKTDFMLSMSITRLVLSIIEAAFLSLFALYVFDVRMQGSFGSLALVFFAGHVAFNGLAVLVASRTDNTRVGNGLINFITMPMFLLSGVFFSYHSFPDWLIQVVKFIPLTVLADALRNIFLFGGDLAGNMFAFVYLVAFGLVCYLIGLRYYKWY